MPERKRRSARLADHAWKLTPNLVDQGYYLGCFGFQQLEQRLAGLVVAGFYRGGGDRVHGGYLVDEYAPDFFQLLLGVDRPDCRYLCDLIEIHSPPGAGTRLRATIPSRQRGG